MAYEARSRDPLLDEETAAVIERRGRELAGLGSLAAGLAVLAVMWSYAPSDPSWLAATDGPVLNWLGRPGAAVASPLTIIVGGGAYALGLILAAWGVRLALHRGHRGAASRLLFAPLAVAAASLHAATLAPGAAWSHSFGLGGLFGDTVLGALLAGLPVSTMTGLRGLSAVSALLAVGLLLFAAGARRGELARAGRFLARGVLVTYDGAMGRAGRGAARLGTAARDRVARRREGAAAARTEREAARPDREAPGIVARLRPIVGRAARLVSRAASMARTRRRAVEDEPAAAARIERVRREPPVAARPAEIRGADRLVARPSAGPVPYGGGGASLRRDRPGAVDPAEVDPREAWRTVQEGMAEFRTALASTGAIGRPAPSGPSSPRRPARGAGGSRSPGS